MCVCVCMCAQNSTTLDLSFRLLLPSPQLAQQVLRRPQEQNMNSFEIRLPPLQPGQGEDTHTHTHGDTKIFPQETSLQPIGTETIRLHCEA